MVNFVFPFYFISIFAICIFLIELPIICRVSQIQKTAGEFLDEKLTPIIKTVLYILYFIIFIFLTAFSFAIPPIALCPCASSILPSVLLFLTALLNFCSYQNMRDQANSANSGNNV